VAAEDLRQTHDLLEGQQFSVRQKLIVGAEHFLWHAVGAAEVAAVGDRNTQVAEAAATCVYDRTCCIALGRRNGQERSLLELIALVVVCCVLVVVC
jgi:hypothetical protein